VGSIRAIWAVQDKITLDEQEEKAIASKRKFVASQKRVRLAPALLVPHRDVELGDTKIARMKRAIENSTGMPTASAATEDDLNPLVHLLFPTL
jgi:hypothetical protein